MRKNYVLGVIFMGLMGMVANVAWAATPQWRDHSDSGSASLGDLSDGVPVMDEERAPALATEKLAPGSGRRAISAPLIGQLMQASAQIEVGKPVIPSLPLAQNGIDGGGCYGLSPRDLVERGQSTARFLPVDDSGAMLSSAEPVMDLEVGTLSGAGMLPVVDYQGGEYFLMAKRSAGGEGAGCLATLGGNSRREQSDFENAVGTFSAKTKYLFCCPRKHGKFGACSARKQADCARTMIAAACERTYIAPETVASKEPLMADEQYTVYGVHLKLPDFVFSKLSRKPHPSVAHYVLVSLADMRAAIRENDFISLRGHDGNEHPVWRPTADMMAKHQVALATYIDGYIS